MIACGAQIRAARGFLGWSQKDLAQAAGLTVNAVRYWEAQHGLPIHEAAAVGYGPERITQALRKAGLELQFDPPAVGVNPHLFNRAMRPPIYERWQRWRKTSLGPTRDAQQQLAFAHTLAAEGQRQK
jgi:transcriptional regulator with XRE-family HTH domain